MAKAFPNTGATTGLAADRTAMTGMFSGQLFFETDTKKLFIYDGTTWNLIQSLKAPTQTFFYGNGANLSTVTSTTQLIKPASVFVNTNSGYNATTGVFTAPVQGTYLVNGVISVYSTGSDIAAVGLSLRVNNSTYAVGYDSIKYITTGTHTTTRVNTIVTCDANTTFSFHADASNTVTLYSGTEFMILQVADKI